jgi:hypothetical protein
MAALWLPYVCEPFREVRNPVASSRPPQGRKVVASRVKGDNKTLTLFPGQNTPKPVGFCLCTWSYPLPILGYLVAVPGTREIWIKMDVP